MLSSGVVQNGYIEVEVTTNPNDSTIRKVNQSVADVQADRSEFAKIVRVCVCVCVCQSETEPMC